MRQNQELSYNAWPALQTINYDGWLLRFAEGYTRRANSINPIYESRVALAEKIAYCERVYARRGQNTVFKLPAGNNVLDTALHARGYAKEAITSVQILDDLTALETPTGGISFNHSVEHDLSSAWQSVFCSLNRVDARHVPTMRRMLENIIPATCYMMLHREGQAVAVGLGVLERGYLGIFDIVTAADFRNQGLGTRLMLHLLHWGRSNGATRAYLQVMLNNAPAQRLYAKLGFREVYRYWYRVRFFDSIDYTKH